MLPRVSRDPRPFVCPEDRSDPQPLTFDIRPAMGRERASRRLRETYTRVEANASLRDRSALLDEIVWETLLSQVVRARNVREPHDVVEGEALRALLETEDLGEERLFALYQRCRDGEIDEMGKASSPSSSSGEASAPPPDESGSSSG